MTKPSDTAPVWPNEPMIVRFMACRTMLAGYGFLNQSEDLKVRKRIAKWRLHMNLLQDNKTRRSP